MRLLEMIVIFLFCILIEYAHNINPSFLSQSANVKSLAQPVAPMMSLRSGQFKCNQASQEPWRRREIRRGQLCHSGAWGLGKCLWRGDHQSMHCLQPTIRVAKCNGSCRCICLKQAGKARRCNSYLQI